MPRRKRDHSGSTSTGPLLARSRESARRARGTECDRDEPSDHAPRGEAVRRRCRSRSMSGAPDECARPCRCRLSHVHRREQGPAPKCADVRSCLSRQACLRGASRPARLLAAQWRRRSRAGLALPVDSRRTFRPLPDKESKRIGALRSCWPSAGASDTSRRSDESHANTGIRSSSVLPIFQHDAGHSDYLAYR